MIKTLNYIIFSVNASKIKMLLLFKFFVTFIDNTLFDFYIYLSNSSILIIINDKSPVARAALFPQLQKSHAR